MITVVVVSSELTLRCEIKRRVVVKLSRKTPPQGGPTESFVA